MKGTVHDFHLFAYEVNGRERSIVLHTEFPHGERPFKQVDVLFEHVMDHCFRNPSIPSIIFAIEEADAFAIVSRDKHAIDEGHRTGGWPTFWDHTVESMTRSIFDAGCKMFEITSSIGLEGWVVARSCTIVPVAP